MEGVYQAEEETETQGGAHMTPEDLDALAGQDRGVPDLVHAPSTDSTLRTRHFFIALLSVARSNRFVLSA